MDVTHLDFCKAFNTISHKIHLSKLERYRFDGWTLWWVRNWLEGHNRKVVVNGSMTKWTPVTSCVPQGLTWGVKGWT